MTYDDSYVKRISFHCRSQILVIWSNIVIVVIWAKIVDFSFFISVLHSNTGAFLYNGEVRLIIKCVCIEEKVVRAIIEPSSSSLCLKPSWIYFPLGASSWGIIAEDAVQRALNNFFLFCRTGNIVLENEKNVIVLFVYIFICVLRWNIEQREDKNIPDSWQLRNFIDGWSYPRSDQW